MSNPGKILYIINGMTKNKGTVSVSGGDVRLLEIVRNNKKFETYLLTTPNGKEFFDKYHDVHFKKVYSINHMLEAGVISNLIISWKSLFFGRSGAREFSNGIVYSSCEHIYDVLPALRLKLFHGCTWYAVYHWVEEYPWRDKRGNTPTLQRYAYWLNRWVSGFLIKHFSDKILAVSDQTKDKLLQNKKVKKQKVTAVYCGVNFDEIRGYAEKYKSEKGTIYDAVFMKRLNYGKGVLDLLKIWAVVVTSKSDAKLAIIGDGTPDVIEKVKEFIQKHGLEKNIDILGVIYDSEEKFRIINSSKIFLLPTREENWAIVIGEAMATGIPVVVSKLKEIEPIWKNNVMWCEVGNIEQFSAVVLKLMNDTKLVQNLSEKALAFIPRYDWKKIADNEFMTEDTSYVQ